MVSFKKYFPGLIFWALSFALVSLLPVFTLEESNTVVHFVPTDAWGLPVALIGGPFYLGVFFLGELVRILFQGESVPLALALSFSKVLGAGLGWFLCTRSGFDSRLKRMKDVLLFWAVAGFVSQPVASLAGGLFSLWLGRPEGFLYYFLDLFMGSIISVEALGFIVLVFFNGRSWNRSEILQSAGIALLAAVLSMTFLGRFFPLGYSSIEIMIALIPLALVFGLKKGLFGAASFQLGLTWAYVETTAAGFGPFHKELIPNSVGALILFVNGLAVLNFLLTALFQESKQAQKELESYDQKKSQFLLRLSHEMKTPLNGILGTAELLKDKVVTPELKSEVDTIIRTGQELDRLTMRILDFLQTGKEESVGPPPLPPLPEVPQETHPSLENLEILVVEDNPLNLEITQRFLGQMGMKSEPASHGLEALEKISRKNYDLVFMDLSMPILDGYETTRRIRERQTTGKRPVIVALTAHALEKEREKAKAVGMDDFLTKPIRKDALKNTILRWVGV